MDHTVLANGRPFVLKHCCNEIMNAAKHTDQMMKRYDNGLAININSTDIFGRVIV